MPTITMVSVDLNENGSIDANEFKALFYDHHWSDMADNLIGGLYAWRALEYAVSVLFRKRVSLPFLVLVNLVATFTFEVVDAYTKFSGNQEKIFEALLSKDTLEDTLCAVSTTIAHVVMFFVEKNPIVRGWALIAISSAFPLFLLLSFYKSSDESGSFMDVLDNLISWWSCESCCSSYRYTPYSD